MSGDRELDVVVFGATGFAGRLVAGSSPVMRLRPHRARPAF